MITHTSRFKIALALATFFIFTIELQAQDAGSLFKNSQNSEADQAVIALSSWIDLDAPPGREQFASDIIMPASGCSASKAPAT